MSLSAGARIGSFEILSHIGAGGMGEVYRARDTKLGRDVAVKILPDAFALDPERLARFRREAHVLASLNHSNIAHIYGLEDDGGRTALVMELVEGPTLADRIARGPIPFDEALSIAKQIAQALDAAHERGIIHRDLKPGNIKLDDDGTVKVLDFGLAKALEPSPISDVSNSPTITSPAMTERGVILGTAGYMAPEQAKGRAADKRADIFAFGVVFYEMLTGRRLFEGETVSELVASVIKEDPSLDAVPASVRPLLRKCLEKDPKRRLRDIGDVWLLLSEGAGRPATSARASWPWVLAATTGAIAAAAIATAWWALARPSETMAPVVHFTVDAPAGTLFSPPNIASISPDGSWIAFGALESTSEPTNLWLRSIRSGTVRRIAGTEGGGAPFWSPDSRSFAFPRGGKLMRVELAGGSPVALCDLTGSTLPGSWSRTGTILFPGSDGLYGVPASGGTPTRLTTVDATRQEMGHAFPEFLPDGNRFLFFIASTDANTRGIYLSALDTPGSRQRILATDTKASYVPPRAGRPGVLLFVRGSALVAQEFDPASLRLSPDTTLVAEGLVAFGYFGGQNGQVPFWSSPAGALLYRIGTLSYAVNWVDRTGRRSSSGMPVVHYFDLRVSPDNTRVAIARPQQGRSDMWLWDFGREAWARLTTGAYYANFPAWSADSGQVAFSQTSPAGAVVSRTKSDGSGPIETLIEDDTQMTVHDWSPDGRYVLYTQRGDVWVLPLRSTPRTPVPFIRGPFSENGSKFSPRGKFVSFTSNELGREEVYIQAFTEPAVNTIAVSGRRWPVSRNGGSTALWRGDGKELYYISSDNKMMAAEVQLGEGTVTVGNVRELFGATFMTLNVLPYGVTSDGQRFLVLEARDPGLHPPFTVSVNWQDALQK